MNAIPQHFRAGLGFTPRTVDEKSRTVELVASTGAGVVRQDMAGPFTEVLALAAGAVDLSRLDGMPLLDSHRQDDLGRVLGVVRSARIEGGQLIVSVQLSERHEAIWRDILAGVVRNVSVGYSIDAYEDRTAIDGGRLRAVTKWTLMEVSLVPVGADAGAKTRSVPMPEVTPTPTPPAPATPPAPVVTRAAINAEIRALGREFSIPAEVLDPLIDNESTVDQARAAILDHQRRQITAPGPRAVTIVTDHTDPALMIARAGEALYARARPGHQLSEPARQYAGLTMADLARTCLQRAGTSTLGMGPADLVTRALNTTSDYPLIFADTANRSLRAAYDAAPAVLKSLARQTSAKDFRAKTKLQIGEVNGTLEKVNEHGEYKYSSFTEAGESYAIDTFGKIFGISRKAIINDDVGAFVDIGGKLGALAAEFEAQFLVDLLESGSGQGPTMADGVALFHADHGNKSGSAAAPSATTFAAGRLAMRKQTGLSGKPINVRPRYVLVPADYETAAEKELATINPGVSTDVNPFAGKLELLVEARLSSTTRWWMVGDPAVIEGLEYSYLAGAEGPQTETRAGFDVDGVETKVRLDFGAAFIDYRGWYMNGS